MVTHFWTLTPLTILLLMITIVVLAVVVSILALRKD